MRLSFKAHATRNYKVVWYKLGPFVLNVMPTMSSQSTNVIKTAASSLSDFFLQFLGKIKIGNDFIIYYEFMKLF